MSKTVAGGDGDQMAAPACLGAFGVGDPFHRPRRVLGLGGQPLQGLCRRLFVVDHVQVRDRSRQLIRPGQAAVGVFRDGPCHGDGALDEIVEGCGGSVRRRHHGLAGAGENPQTQVSVLRPLQIFRLAEASPLAQRDAVDEDGIGGVGAGTGCLGDEIGQQMEAGIEGVHDG